MLALLGSGEFLPWARQVDSWCAERATAPSERALIVPTASAPEGEDVFANWAAMGTEHYRALGLEPVVLPLRGRADASDPAIVDAVARARIVFFSGGNPGYLVESVRETPFWDAVLDAVAQGTALGGCSAGAVAVGVNAPYVSEMSVDHWTRGLALLSRAYVVPHFDALESFQKGLRRLALEACPPGATTVAIDEDTALCGNGESWSVTGAGAVWTSQSEDLAPQRDGERFVLPLGLTLERPG